MNILAPLLFALFPFQNEEPPTLRVDETVSSAIEEGDAVIETEMLRAYTVAPTVGRAFRFQVDETGSFHLDLHSVTFDSYLVLRDAVGSVLAENDDGGVGFSARIEIDELRAGEMYRVEACALHGNRGPFELTLRRGVPPTLTPAEEREQRLDELGARASVIESTFGSEHRFHGRALRELAIAMHDQGQLEPARRLFLRAIEIHQKTLGAEHPVVADSMIRLSGVLQEEGKLDEARPLLEHALVIQLEVLGSERREVVVCLIRLGILLSDQGSYDEAREHFERSIEICEKLESAPELLAHGLNHFASSLRRQELFEEALVLYERALVVGEEAFGADHPDLAVTCSDLATLLEQQKRFEEAWPYLERAVWIWRKAHPSGHPDITIGLTGLGRLARELGRWEDAEFFFTQALEGGERVLGAEHPRVATILEHMGTLAYMQGRHAKARGLFELALRIREDVLGSDHPTAITSRGRLSIFLADTGNPRAAWEHVRRAHEHGRAQLPRTLATYPESELYRTLAAIFRRLEILVSIAEVLDGEAIARASFEAVAEWKGQIAHSLIATRPSGASGFTGFTGAQEEILAELRGVQSELSNLAFDDAGEREPREARIDELRRRRDALELTWRRSAPEKVTPPRVSLDALLESLPPRSALLQFLGHRVRLPARLEGTEVREPGRWTGEHLSVWIARGDGALPVHLDLGSVHPIESAAQRFLAQVVGVPAPGSEEDPAEALRTHLWDPIAPHVAGLDTLFVSPDGVIATLPFETIPLADESYLLEHFSFVYQEDFVALGARAENPTLAAGALLSVGGVDFMRRGAPEASEEVTPPGPRCPLRSGLGFWPGLPHTFTEARAVHDVHAATYGERAGRTLLSGPEATEERLKRELPRHAILHLATHGYFQPPELTSSWEGARVDESEPGPRRRSRLRPLAGHHPALLSGLVGAGVNSGARDARDDGYLTAEEVSRLDLSGVELVVLSACDTGLGRRRAGEGLLGLRRAFRSAGTPTVINSMWEAPAAETTALMQSFYGYLWGDGMGRGEALRRARLEMLEHNRETVGEGLPATWGAFVLSGDWR